MARRQMPSEQREERDAPELAGAVPIESGTGSGESKIRKEELFRMAAFRIRETANRIVTLANTAQDPALRKELLIICERLLEEELHLLGRS